MTGSSAAVLAVLEEAQAEGFLGPGAVQRHVVLAHAFVTALEPPGAALDLGSGGGVPGLILAEAWPATELVLLDRSARRTGFLRRAVVALGWQDRVRVLYAEAEEAGRGELRGTLDAVVARSFGPPAVVAECGAPFLRVGGSLLIAEPPGGEDRWPAEPLAMLGLVPERRLTAPVSLQVLALRSPVPERFPRRPGVPSKRPLW